MHTSYICDLTSHMWGASLLLAPHSFGLSVVVSYRVSGPPLQSQVAARRSELRIHSCVSYTGELTCVCPCTQWLELTQTHTHDTHTQVTLTAVSSPSRDSPLSCVTHRYRIGIMTRVTAVRSYEPTASRRIQACTVGHFLPCSKHQNASHSHAW